MKRGKNSKGNVGGKGGGSGWRSRSFDGVPYRGIARELLRDAARHANGGTFARAGRQLHAERNAPRLQPLGIVGREDAMYGRGKTRRDAPVAVLYAVQCARIGQSERLRQRCGRQMLLAQDNGYACPNGVDCIIGCRHDESVCLPIPDSSISGEYKKCGVD